MNPAPPKLRCASCGYDLSSLGQDALCPECGRVSDSDSDPELLRNCAADYLTTLSRGALIVETCWVLHVLLGGVGFLIGLLVGLGQIASKFRIPIPHALNIFALPPASVNLTVAPASLAIDGLALVGWWMLTAPSAIESEGAVRKQARRVLRIVLALFLVIEVSKFVLMLTPAFRSISSGNSVSMSGNSVSITGGSTLTLVGIGLGTLIYLAALVAQFFLSMQHMKDLALRAEDRTLARHIEIGLWALPALYLVGTMCFFMGPFVAGLGFIWFVGRVRVRIASHRDAVLARA